MKRRTLLTGTAIAGATSLLSLSRNTVANTHSTLDKTMPAKPVEKITLTDAEWKARLSPEAYKVLRKEGTERAWTSPLNDEKRDGVFACAGCDLPLFESQHKFDSGTGWPSFYQAIEGHVETKRDYKLFRPRTEYHCIRCGGHQGHVFEDGPAPTGLRYCNNGVALTFIPA